MLYYWLYILCKKRRAVIRFKHFFLSLIISVLLFSSSFSLFAASPEDELILGVFPRRNAVATTKLFTPLAKYLSTELGRNVHLVIAKDFPTFWSNVKQGYYDIVQFNQYHYVISNDKFGYQVIAKNEEFGKSKLSSAIVVRQDSGIKRLEDLKGKKILFGGDESAFVAYMCNTIMLRRAGLKKGDYIEEFAKNPPNATYAIFYKQAAAAGVGDIALSIPMVKSKIDTSELSYLAIGEALPHLPWAVKSKLPNALRTKVKQAMLNLNHTAEGQIVLKRAHLSGINAATDGEYDIVRRLIKEFERDSIQNR